MSKELEAVKQIGMSLIRNYDNTKGGNGYAFFGEELNIIEKALKALEIIRKYCYISRKNPIPKEEYKLLTEVLNDKEEQRKEESNGK